MLENYFQLPFAKNKRINTWSSRKGLRQMCADVLFFFNSEELRVNPAKEYMGNWNF